MFTFVHKCATNVLRTACHIYLSKKQLLVPISSEIDKGKVECFTNFLNLKINKQINKQTNKIQFILNSKDSGRLNHCRLPEKGISSRPGPGVSLKTSPPGNRWQFSHSRTKLGTGYSLIKQVGRAPRQRLLLKFCAVTARLLLEVQLYWFQEVCCSKSAIGISLIPLKSTTSISLNQIDQIKTAKDEFFKKGRGGRETVICRLLSVTPNLDISDIGLIIFYSIL